MARGPPDNSTIFTQEEFESDSYKMKNKVMTVYFCLHTPHGPPQSYKPVGIDTPNKCIVPFDGKVSQVDVDVKTMNKFYSERFGKEQLVVMVFPNFSWNDKEELEKLDKKAKGCDAFFFHFFTYLKDGGKENYKLEFAGEALPLDEVFEKIKLLKSFSSMALKPKVFIIQADDLNMLKPTVITKAVPTTKKYRIPSDADFMVIMSTIPQVLASKPRTRRTEENQPVVHPSDQSSHQTGAENSDGQKCSLLVQAIVNIQTDPKFKDDDLFSNTPEILGRVREIVEKTDFGDKYKDYPIPVPTTMSTLTKFLYFKHQ
ncbi:uncharacterized protein LOC127845588 [Dreissena polymorpha]|uniref:Peptidase C14 caspase domain-containing protein n=1 Tax=Dreissena polymorpha TaxID=45954 RepID=A0A9D4EAD6_DREPO|nr:uncharacterized protein LOC127845588 [Dreissena polymorpha]KAH3776742.1 hypothetical protein DPMN_178175 [Dreissena polymorpha]